MKLPYMVAPPVTAGLLLPTGNTFFSPDEAALNQLRGVEPTAREPWLFLARALIDAREGHFDRLWELSERADAFAWEDYADACEVLLGAAAPQRLLRRLATANADASLTTGLGSMHTFRVLTQARLPWGAAHVLAHLDQLGGSLSDRREAIVRCVQVLEPGMPWLDEDSDLLERERARLGAVAQTLVATPGVAAIACMDGKPLHLADIVLRMLEIAGGPSVGNFAALRVVFEAYTGIDCSHFYVEHRLQKLAAAATLEDFLESGAAERFEPGIRYFFGQPIPE